MTTSTPPTGPSTAATPAGSSTAASPRRRGRPRSGWFRAETEALAAPAPPLTSLKPIRLGLRANWRQFALLVLINAFVGGVVGVERSTLAPLAEHDFQVVSRTAILSFLISFGLVKAGSNLAAGWLADRFGRRMILVAGWIAALPVAPLIIFAPSWSWIVAANVLLGINQGLCWSTTVNMKIDLVGPRRRGLAMGLNEAAGYLAVSLAALATGYIAVAYGLRPQPFLLGVAFAIAGFLLTLVWVRESSGYAREEAFLTERRGEAPSFLSVVVRTSWSDR